MNLRPFAPQRENPHHVLSRVFNVVMLYEDGETGRHAKHLSDKLSHQLGNGFAVSRNLWSFDVLGIDEVADTAAEMALTADLLIVSASGERDLPTAVEKWLKRWTSTLHGKTPALAGLFKKSAGGRAWELHLFLRMLAGEAGLPYFPHASFDPLPEFVRAEQRHLAEVGKLEPTIASAGTARPEVAP